MKRTPDKLTDADVKLVGGHAGNLGSHAGITQEMAGARTRRNRP